MFQDKFLNVITSLKSRNLSEIKRAIDIFLEDSRSKSFDSSLCKKDIEEIEKNFYRALSNFLELGQFEKFKQLIDYSDRLNIFIDAKKIPKRFEIISNLHLNGLRTGQIGKVFEIIRFCQEYNLFDKDLSKEELDVLESIKKDKLLLANLSDLFGEVSNSLIFYVSKAMPRDLYRFFKNYFRLSNFYDQNLNDRGFYDLNLILRYLDKYSIYGLLIENLGTVQRFITNFEKYYFNILNKEKENDANKDSILIEFYFKNKLHLVAPENIIKNKKNILSKDKYIFHSLSMVALRGLGPQGMGFTYSTPKGELIEICSDIKENEAIIVKYKQFLKRQFLAKLESEMSNLLVNAEVIKKIIKFLSDALKYEKIVNYYKKNAIIQQIKNFFNEDKEFQNKHEIKIQNLIDIISESITLILRDIKLEDQFKTRMDLIAKDKLKSEEIAKLTSLKGKSHYDVLRERLFFQYVIKWFHEIYIDEALKSRK